MFCVLFSYLKFLLKSTNEHGVHSPFVFNYVTKCLYLKQKRDNIKSINILLKSIAYFNHKNIELYGKQDLKKPLQIHFPNMVIGANMIDVVYADELEIDMLKRLFSEEKLHNNSMIFINSIHQTPEKQELWRNLIELPLITVSIDMFHCGVLFIRKEQVKEHFIIRI
ncbi:hypothetical protein AAY42_00410 [Flagellimonas eckloniae]|uniref:Uncharacterized protein n=2 Tax=Flagellimonas eckloniae TaxID=346185 RepID=A0A0Q1BVK5_9FLAO|nr:hypothetical protein AAY42_00410 [Allomuricauda eckloniae]